MKIKNIEFRCDTDENYNWVIRTWDNEATLHTRYQAKRDCLLWDEMRDRQQYNIYYLRYISLKEAICALVKLQRIGYIIKFDNT
jgi:phosphopantetheinyl transferase